MLLIKGETMNNTKEAAHELLLSLGYDLNNPHIKETPERFAKAMRFLTNGEREDVSKHFKTFDNDFTTDGYSQMIVLDGIDYYSLCEHHVLPFYGQVHVGYIPNEHKVVGLSKIARVVEVFARRLQVQERMTEQIADAIERYLNPEGVIVVVEGAHLCMRMRGIQKPNAVMTTSAIKGAFKNNAPREEFFSILRLRGARQ